MRLVPTTGDQIMLLKNLHHHFKCTEFIEHD